MNMRCEGVSHDEAKVIALTVLFREGGAGDGTRVKTAALRLAEEGRAPS